MVESSRPDVFDRILFYCGAAFVFFLGWTAAFRFGDWLPIFNVFFIIFLSTGIFQFFILRRPISFVYMDPSDWLILAFLAHLFLASLFVNSSKTINYLSAYFFVLGGQYLLFKVFWSRIGKLRPLLVANAIGTLVVVVFAWSEIIAGSVFAVQIQSWIPRSKEATATIGSGTIARAHSFATEATTLASYILAFGPLACLFWKERLNQSNFGFAILLMLYIGTLLFTFSVAGIAIATLILLLFSSYLLKIKLSKRSWALILCLFLIVSFLVYQRIDQVLEVAGDIFRKATLDSNYRSVSQRMDQLQIGIRNIMTYPGFGIGLGTTSDLGLMSSINWYIFLASEAGLWVMIWPAAFIVSKLYQTRQLLSPYREVFLASLIMASLYLFFNSSFWIPYLFFLSGLLSILVRTKGYGRHVS